MITGFSNIVHSCICLDSLGVEAYFQETVIFFITCRGYGEFIDMWEFPGGKIEQGEIRKQALKREIKGELSPDKSTVLYPHRIRFLIS